jgi:CMP-N,N'-diacetyllegionaminic acid synthase
MQKKILGIIGLRAGSKGLKNKNIKLLGGIPLFAHILKSAKKSKLINKVIISTDSILYKQLAIKHGAEVPFLRPKNLAKDNSNEIDFIIDLLKKLKKKYNYEPDIIVRLLATCPFQKTQDIDKLIQIILFKNFSSAVIISKAKQHPNKALKIIGKNKNKIVSFFSNSGHAVGSNLNRQSFVPAYFRSNVIACRTEVIKKYNSLTGSKVGYLLIPGSRTVDIDSKHDFEYAEFLLRKGKKK